MADAPWFATHAYLIPLLPLVSAIVIFFFGRWLPTKGAWLGILAIATSWLFSIELFLHLMEGSLHSGFEMRAGPGFQQRIYPFEWGILLDGPSIVMLLVVTTVRLCLFRCIPWGICMTRRGLKGSMPTCPFLHSRCWGWCWPIITFSSSWDGKSWEPVPIS